MEKKEAWSDEMSMQERMDYTLLCIYIRTLSAEERARWMIRDDSFDKVRFHAKIMRALEDQELLAFDWESMEATLTEDGRQLAKITLQRISALE